MIGASTAAHQVEGNNIFSDAWAQEHMKHSQYKEPSGDAMNHYNLYEDDIRLMAEAGLNAYRFSIEWARIEPEHGEFQDKEIEHYKNVIKCCRKYGIEPIVTMHHFTSPKWLITEGGWESEKTIEYFADYCKYVITRLGDLITYVCTINEANLGLQIKKIVEDMMAQNGANPQVGLNFEADSTFQLQLKEEGELFHLNEGEHANCFLSMRTDKGDQIIGRAHEAARNAMKEIYPHLKVGITLSLFDLQSQPGGEDICKKEWDDDFAHYLPYLEKDDFIGVQNYTRKIVGPHGNLPVPENCEVTQMGYEYYPESIGNVIRHVASQISLPILITENGVATDCDERRVEFIDRALNSIKKCIQDGIEVKGYLHWSLLDNFEWQEGYDKTFGLIAVDRQTQKRTAKPSLTYLGSKLDNLGK